MAQPDRRSSPIDSQPRAQPDPEAVLLELLERYRLVFWIGVSTTGLLVVRANPSGWGPIVSVLSLLVVFEATLRGLRSRS